MPVERTYPVRLPLDLQHEIDEMTAEIEHHTAGERLQPLPLFGRVPAVHLRLDAVYLAELAPSGPRDDIGDDRIVSVHVA